MHSDSVLRGVRRPAESVDRNRRKAEVLADKAEKMASLFAPCELEGSDARKPKAKAKGKAAGKAKSKGQAKHGPPKKVKAKSGQQAGGKAGAKQKAKAKVSRNRCWAKSSNFGATEHEQFSFSKHMRPSTL